jgi:hypothetical protein
MHHLLADPWADPLPYPSSLLRKKFVTDDAASSIEKH